jgi:son of sevenless-like protein
MQGKLQALYDIIDPMGNHRGYREALNDVSSIEQRDRCIPWLGQFRLLPPTNPADDFCTAVHLKELHLVLQRYPITVQVDGRPLINFQRYLKFMDRVNEVVHYKPPNLEQYRQLGHLDYLESQLRNVRMTSTSDDDLMARSKFLEARETLDFRTRRPQLQALGFRTR